MLYLEKLSNRSFTQKAVYRTCFAIVVLQSLKRGDGSHSGLKTKGFDPSTIMTYMGNGPFRWSPDSDREVRLSQMSVRPHTTTSSGVLISVAMVNPSKNLFHIHTFQAKIY